MLGYHNEKSRIYDALDRSNAIIKFDLDGKILGANKNFLDLMGYGEAEIVGKHHKIFVPEADRNGPEYLKFWNNLGSGKFFTAEFRRIDRNGKDIWIQGSYNPVLRNGKPEMIIEIASDVTTMAQARIRSRRQLDAVDRSQAIIEFSPDGTITDANQNFLNTMGYRLEDIRGKHHRMFVEQAEANSDSYRQFWDELRKGKFQSRQFRRMAKGGREVWIQASYNPLVDEHGHVIGIIKFASDITAVRKEQLKDADHAVAEVNSLVQGVSSLINSANSQAEKMAGSVGDVSSNVQAVAKGSSELASSVREINEQVAKALKISNEAVDRAQKAGGTVASLVDDARKISAVVDLISTIASQTNLLALNATIEAARAGDAGRGFAVVAGEVKSLAAQTTKATGEITDHINAVQASSRHAHDAISAITGTIHDLNQISVSISAAVEQQAAVTDDMSRNMRNAAEGVDDIASGMESVADITQKADQAVRTIAAAARAAV